MVLPSWNVKRCYPSLTSVWFLPFLDVSEVGAFCDSAIDQGLILPQRSWFSVRVGRLRRGRFAGDV